MSSVMPHKKEIVSMLKSRIIYQPEAVRVYVMGSLAASRVVSFNKQLSDIDLLYIFTGNTLQDYTQHFGQAVDLAARLTSLDRRYGGKTDLFFIPSSIVSTHFLSTSIIPGLRVLDAEDCIVGQPLSFGENLPYTPTLKTRQKLYRACAQKVQREHIFLFPQTDTSKARKAAKTILRGLKLVVCAHATPDRLLAIEQKLFTVSSFKEVRPYLESLFSDVPDFDPVLDRSIQGRAVDDWATWMVAQNTIVTWLHDLDMSGFLTKPEYRLIHALRDIYVLLMTDLKNTVIAPSKTVRVALIESFLNITASVIVRLALAGVESLKDFESEETPAIVTQGYTHFTEYLEGDLPPDDSCLAAAVILLEHAFKEGLIHVNGRDD